MKVNTEANSKNKRFEATVLGYTNLLYRVALQKTKNESDAEDLVQDTCLKAYMSFNRFKDGTNCKAWLLTVLKNTFLNKVIRERRNPVKICTSKMEAEAIDLPSKDNLEDEIFRDMLDDDVTAALDSLRSEYRTAVLLADVKGLTYKEIADLMGCPIGTVMSRLYRGRMLLKEKLKYYADEHGYHTAKAVVG